MKCYSCGGEVNLTDKVCPFCGRPLTETASYRADEEKYKKRSEKTKSKIGVLISENVPIVISAVVMILLIIAVSVASYINENAYSFKDEAMRKESVKMYDSYRPIIQEYLDAGDYTGFAAFKEYHNIAEWEEPYDDLCLLWEITKEYSDLLADVESAVINGPNAEIYRPERNVDNCHSAIWQFYYEFENNKEEIDADPYKEYMYDMKDKADIILEIYLGMDEQARKDYFEGSEAKQKAYLEEVLLDD